MYNVYVGMMCSAIGTKKRTLKPIKFKKATSLKIITVYTSDLSMVKLQSLTNVVVVKFCSRIILTVVWQTGRQLWFQI